ncbi:MAG: hypothetical protein QM579_07575 [Desulfovibrio sp.]|uniref:hypothetical protein n=1 Tax=Desulfovibrio sp. TaxID=885 RepID=UPI0039E43AC3
MIVLAAGCVAPQGRAQLFAQAHEFSEVRFATVMFTLQGWVRLPANRATAVLSASGGAANETLKAEAGGEAVTAKLEKAEIIGTGATRTLRIYIEGDGYAWRSRTRPSEDPTPRDPVGLRLAAADPGPDPVLYLARPCQYVRGEDRRNCEKRYWTTARLGDEVLQSLDDAISQAKARYGADRIVLIGFSGGGGVAALLAAKRRDVAFLGTVAGNLDTEAWATLHNLSPLADSVNPISVAPALQGLPQLHLSSSGDAIMPPSVSAGFCRSIQQPEACVVLDGISHAGPWEDYWDYGLATTKN